MGKEQAVVYRATITQDGQIIMYDKNGNKVAEADSGTSSDATDEPTSSDGSVDVNYNVSDLTTEELQQLAENIIEELSSRVSE